MSEGAGRRRLRTEHAEQAKRVQIEGVGEREHVEAGARECVQAGSLVAPRNRREELGQLAVEVAHELRIQRESLQPGRLPRRALHDRRENPRQHDHHEVVAQLHRPRTLRRLALRDLRDHAAIDRHELRQLRHAGDDGVRPRARRELNLLAWRSVEHPEVVHHEERQPHTQARQIAPPPHRPDDEHRRPRAHRRQDQPSKGADDRGIPLERRRYRHDLRDYFHWSGVTPMLSLPLPLIELRSGFNPTCFTQCQAPTSFESARTY